MNQAMPSSITSAGSTKPPYIHAIQFDGELHFKATGDGMKPTINPSDYYQGSGIYLIEANGLVQIRRLDRHRNGICIMTDNPIYENEIVPEHMFRVLAKADCVLKKCAA